MPIRQISRYGATATGKSAVQAVLIWTLLLVAVPTPAMQVDDTLLMSIPPLIGALNKNAGQLPVPPPRNTRECTHEYVSAENKYVMWCDTKQANGQVTHRETLVFRPGSDSEQEIVHSYYNPADAFRAVPVSFTIFSYRKKDLDLWASNDWYVEQAVTNIAHYPTYWESLNHYQCLLSTSLPPQQTVNVGLVERLSDQDVREWPAVSCDESPDLLPCAEKIKARGDMDQCGRAALALHKYAPLRSFPGACSEAWNHRDKNGVLQKCGL